MKIPLVQCTITHKEIDALCDWLKTYPRLTKGELTLEFERKYAEWMGMKYAVFTNSGSAANLIALAALEEIHKNSSRKVVVPDLAWATDLSPVIQLGLQPIMCDCNYEDLSVNLDHLEAIFAKENPLALILVSVLGLVPKMDEIKMLCETYNVVLIEDVCESLGSKCFGKKLGTYGLMSTCSFYYGHHMSTVEGGVVLTNNREVKNILMAIRSHGWLRDCDFDFREKNKSKYNISDFRDAFTFYYFGYNARNTDIGAFLGLQQLESLDANIELRNANFMRYHKCFEGSTIRRFLQRDGDFVSSSAFPILAPNRNVVASNCTRAGIETRPIISGSLSSHPFYQKRYGIDHDVINTLKINSDGIYLPNNPDMSEEDIRYVVKAVLS